MRWKNGASMTERGGLVGAARFWWVPSPTACAHPHCRPACLPACSKSRLQEFFLGSGGCAGSAGTSDRPGHAQAPTPFLRTTLRLWNACGCFYFAALLNMRQPAPHVPHAVPVPPHPSPRSHQLLRAPLQAACAGAQQLTRRRLVGHITSTASTSLLLPASLE